MGNINVSSNRGSGPLLIVIGAPGSGKSTLSYELASRLGCAYINVGELARERGFILGKDEERDSLILDEDRVRGEISKLLEKSCLVVETISPHAVPKEAVTLVVVVRCRPSILMHRLRARGYGAEKVRENVEYEAVDGPLQDALELAEWERVVQVDGCESDLDREIRTVMDWMVGKKRNRRFNWTEDFMSILDDLSRDQEK